MALNTDSTVFWLCDQEEVREFLRVSVLYSKNGDIIVLSS